MANGTRPWNWRLITAGSNAWINATPAPPSSAVASNIALCPCSPRTRLARKISARPRAIPRRSPSTASMRTAISATRPMHTTGKVVSNEAVWKLMPVARRMSASKGLTELRIGRKFNPSAITTSQPRAARQPCNLPMSVSMAMKMRV
ncbi:hypothetical protein D3C81_1392570 [compost metagenome]